MSKKVMWLVGELELAREHIKVGGKFGGLDLRILLDESAWPLADITIGAAFYRILNRSPHLGTLLSHAAATCGVCRARDDAVRRIAAGPDY
jgi:hypothetical protein